MKTTKSGVMIFAGGCYTFAFLGLFLLLLMRLPISVVETGVFAFIVMGMVSGVWGYATSPADPPKNNPPL